MARDKRTPSASPADARAAPAATRVRCGALALALAASAACSGGGKGGATAPSLQSITIAPASASVPVGLTTAFAATGHYSDGSTQDLTATATWTSSGNAIATVSAGVATGVAIGSATIGASWDAFSAQATLTVTSPVVESMTLTPASASIPVGLTQAFGATALWSDGTTSDATGAATWTTLDGAVATATGNVVTGVAVGSTVVQATLQGVTGSAPVGVTGAIVQAVTISPPAATLAAGTSLQYSAWAVLSDGGKVDVTGSASWASSSTAAATITSAGLATAVAIGDTVISATLSGVTAATPLTVTNATLSSISISPTAPTVPLGVAQAFIATGIFSDGTKEDLTAQVAWTSSAPEVAAVSAQGVATPAATGTTTIVAALGAVSGETTLVVSNAVLVALDVNPPSATVAAGTSVSLTAMGTYTDGTTQDLTAVATWASSGPAVSVSNAAGSQGVATGVSVGTASVSATLDGLTSSAPVTVTSAVLVSIAITPSDATVPAGATQQLAATGTFSDGSTQDLTASVSWMSSDTAVASVSNAAGTEGLVSALAQGSVTITAGYAGVRATTPFTVAGVALVSIEVAPADARLPAGYTLPFSATATYSDGSTLDVTTLVTWASSSSSVATISNAPGSQGLATGVTASATPVLVSATLAGKTGSTSLTVTNAKLSSVAVTPNPFSLGVRATTQLVATGTFQDGTVLDITRQCGWSSSARGVATVSRTGNVTGVARGTVTITAKRTGKTGSASGSVY